MFTPAQIGGMIAQIAVTFEAMLPQIGTIAGISDAALTKVQTAIDDLRLAAQAFATTDAPGEVVSRVENDAEAVLTVLATLPLPPQVALGFRVAQILLPVLISAAQIVFAHKAGGAL